MSTYDTTEKDDSIRKRSATEVRQAMTDIKSAALDSFYISARFRRRRDVENGHALLERYEKYTQHNPQLILFDDNGGPLLGLHIQRRVSRIVKMGIDIRIFTQLEARTEGKSKILEDSLTEFKRDCRGLRDEIAKHIIPDGVNVELEAARIV